MALAYDGQPGAQRIFGGQDLNAVTISSVDPWNDPRGTDGVCVDKGALKAYLASLELELYTQTLEKYASEGERELAVVLDTPQGQLRVRLLDRAAHVTRLWDGPDFHTDSYYLKEPVDWGYLDTLIVPLPELCLAFQNGELDSVACNSLTRIAADGTETVLLEPEEWRYNDYGSSAQEVQLLFALPLAEPYTITAEPLNGGARQMLSQADLPDGLLQLTGPSAKYTVAAKLQDENGTVYDAQYIFIFRTDDSEA